jgi:hypothetical protein
VSFYLNEGGLTIVNLPFSDGSYSHNASHRASHENYGTLRRMWQAGLPSPHLSYFSAETLERLFASAGFDLVRSGRLESMSTKGLYESIRFDRKVGALNAGLIYLAVRVIQILAGAFASDTQYFVFRKIGNRKLLTRSGP